MSVHQGSWREARHAKKRASRSLENKKELKKNRDGLASGGKRMREKIFLLFCFKWYPKPDAWCQVWVPLLTKRGEKSSLKEENAREQVRWCILT